VGLEERGEGALGWLCQLCLLRAWPTHPSWEAWWDGGPCSSERSCGIPTSKASRLSGPVPVSSWSDFQQCPDYLRRGLVSPQKKERLEAVRGWCHDDALQVFMGTAEDLWYLEGTQVRMVLPLQCSHFLSCPSHPSLLPWGGFRCPRQLALGGRDGGEGRTGPDRAEGQGKPATRHLPPSAWRLGLSWPRPECCWPPPSQKCWHLSKLRWL